jgi:hypothetical protein
MYLLLTLVFIGNFTFGIIICVHGYHDWNTYVVGHRFFWTTDKGPTYLKHTLIKLGTTTGCEYSLLAVLFLFLFNRLFKLLDNPKLSELSDFKDQKATLKTLAGFFLFTYVCRAALSFGLGHY